MPRECSVCLETFPGHYVPILFGDRACHRCLRRVYELAIQDEKYFPPQWGGRMLTPQHIPGVLSRELFQRFVEKVNEYIVPPSHRIYCSYIERSATSAAGDEAAACEQFVGRIPADWADQLAHIATTDERPEESCKACGTSYCMLCGVQSDGHQCNKPGPENDESAFEGLERGKDYQICPSEYCHRRVELSAACNLAYCFCGRLLCFICGQSAGSDHFKDSKDEGGCPRFGHPSSDRAIWLSETEGVRALRDAGATTQLIRDAAAPETLRGAIRRGEEQRRESASQQQMRGLRAEAVHDAFLEQLRRHSTRHTTTDDVSAFSAADNVSRTEAAGNAGIGRRSNVRTRSAAENLPDHAAFPGTLQDALSRRVVSDSQPVTNNPGRTRPHRNAIVRRAIMRVDHGAMIDETGRRTLARQIAVDRLIAAREAQAYRVARNSTQAAAPIAEQPGSNARGSITPTTALFAPMRSPQLQDSQTMANHFDWDLRHPLDRSGTTSSAALLPDGPTLATTQVPWTNHITRSVSPIDAIQARQQHHVTGFRQPAMQETPIDHFISPFMVTTSHTQRSIFQLPDDMANCDISRMFQDNQNEHSDGAVAWPSEDMVPSHQVNHDGGDGFPFPPQIGAAGATSNAIAGDATGTNTDNTQGEIIVNEDHQMQSEAVFQGRTHSRST